MKKIFQTVGLAICALVSQHSFALAGDLWAGRMYPPPVPGTLTCTLGGPTGEAPEFYNTLTRSLVTSRHPKLPADFEGMVAPYGHPTDVVLRQSSGDAQFDADCFQTILAAQRHDASNFNLQGVWVFRQNESTQTELNSKTNSIKIFKIPMCVTERYPEAFSRTELLSDENMLALSGNSDTRLSANQVSMIKNHMEQWNMFFDKNPLADKNMIRKEANSIAAKLKE